MELEHQSASYCFPLQHRSEIISQYAVYKLFCKPLRCVFILKLQFASIQL